MTYKLFKSGQILSYWSSTREVYGRGSSKKINFKTTDSLEGQVLSQEKSWIDP